MRELKVNNVVAVGGLMVKVPKVTDISVARNRGADKAQMVKETKSKRGTCTLCKRPNVLIPGGGKCCRCYERLKRGVDPITGKRGNDIGISAQTHNLQVIQQNQFNNIISSDVILRFAAQRDQQLYVILVQQAETNRRTIESEILNILEESLVHVSGALCPSPKILNTVRQGAGTLQADEGASVLPEPTIHEPIELTGSPIFEFINDRARQYTNSSEHGHTWLLETRKQLMKSLQCRGISFKSAAHHPPILTPNAGVFRILGGPRATVSLIESKIPEIFTSDGLKLLAVKPEAGCLNVSIARPEREVLRSEVVFKDYLQKVDGAADDQLIVGVAEENGKPLVIDPYEQPHTLIAGSTGSGKSVLMQNIILSIAITRSPKESKIFLVDPKGGIDYESLEPLPHISGGILTDQEDALGLLEGAVEEMERRYQLFRKAGKGINNIRSYRKVTGKDLPTWWIIHDEFADWMQTKKYREQVPMLVNRLGVKARAVGIFMIFAAQRPDRSIFPSQLRDQLGNRLVLRVQSSGSSVIALGEKGAENLLGKGHMLAKIGGRDSVFAQVPFIDPLHDIPGLVEAICASHKKPRTARSK